MAPFDRTAAALATAAVTMIAMSLTATAAAPETAAPTVPAPIATEPVSAKALIVAWFRALTMTDAASTEEPVVTSAWTVEWIVLNVSEAAPATAIPPPVTPTPTASVPATARALMTAFESASTVTAPALADGVPIVDPSILAVTVCWRTVPRIDAPPIWLIDIEPPNAPAPAAVPLAPTEIATAPVVAVMSDESSAFTSTVEPVSIVLEMIEASTVEPITLTAAEPAPASEIENPPLPAIAPATPTAIVLIVELAVPVTSTAPVEWTVDGSMEALTSTAISFIAIAPATEPASEAPPEPLIATAALPASARIDDSSFAS